MRTFEVVRNNDETGISGTGKVIEGVVFEDGTCVTRWVAGTSPGRSTVIWDSFGAFMAIHVSPHPDNKTEIVFSDGEAYKGPVRTKGPRMVKRPQRAGQRA